MFEKIEHNSNGNAGRNVLLHAEGNALTLHMFINERIKKGALMTISVKDMDILKKFDFSVPPVAVAYSFYQPEGIDRLDKRLTLCEMLKEAQTGKAFYADTENHTCEAGLYVMGIADVPEVFRAGIYGAGLQVFENPRCASRIYDHVPTADRGIIKYVSFAPLDKVSFDPDLLIIMSSTDQTEILLRAASYKTGDMWTSKATPVIGCGYLYIYPYLTGKLNYFTTGLGHGTKRRSLFPAGMQLISIPADMLPSMLQSLQEMPWVLPAYKPDGMEFVRRLLIKIGVNPPE